jgi:hypothetical protein
VCRNICEPQHEREQRESLLALSTVHATIAATDNSHPDQAEIIRSSIVKWRLDPIGEERGE